MGPATIAALALEWPDKAAARTASAQPCSGQLVARKSDSFQWDDTPNVFIEAENLHALKLLRETHSGAIKLAYLDPPYNLGRDATYDDRFGRAAGDWLTMMYPRLLLTRELLTPDGVVCISIDDAELHHLRMLCDEVFGADNFVATFTWDTKRAARGVPPRSRLMHNHEYVVCYARDRAAVRFRGHDRNDDDFANPDDDPRGPWRSESMKATGHQNNFFTITDPASGQQFHANWAFSSGTLERMIADRRVLFPAAASATPRQKKFRDSYTNETKAAVTSLGLALDRAGDQGADGAVRRREGVQLPQARPAAGVLLRPAARSGRHRPRPVRRLRHDRTCRRQPQPGRRR